MKKVLSLILALLVLSMLCSCKKNTEGETDMTNSVTPTSSENDGSSNTSSIDENSSKTSSDEKNTSSTTSRREFMTSTVTSEKIDKLMSAEWRKNPENYKLVAFTFDDAPCYPNAENNNTTKIIDALNKYEGAGTLFCVGKRMDTAHDGNKLLRYALEANFELGNHGYSHVYIGRADEDTAWQEVMGVIGVMEEYLGVTPKWFRPAYSSFNLKVAQVTTEAGTPIIGGDVAGIADYDAATTSTMVEEFVLERVKDGSIVWLHSQAAATAGAMENVCKTLYDQGYRFVTLSELFEFKGVDFYSLPTNKMIQNSNLDIYPDYPLAN